MAGIAVIVLSAEGLAMGQAADAPPPNAVEVPVAEKAAVADKPAADRFAEAASDLASGSVGVRLAAIRILGNPAAAKYAPGVAALLRDKDKEDEEGDVGRQAARTLARMGAKEFADEMLRALPAVPRVTRYGIMEALDRMADERCVEAALSLLPAENVFWGYADEGEYPAHLQEGAAIILAKYRSSKLESRVAAFLNHKSPEARMGAIEALDKMGASRSAKDIAKLLKSGQPPGVRVAAVNALTAFRATEFSRELSAVLRESLSDDENGSTPFVRESSDKGEWPTASVDRPLRGLQASVIGALAEFGAREHVALIAKHLEGRENQSAALEALTRLKAVESADKIALLLDGPLKAEALAALVSLNARDQMARIAELIPDLEAVRQRGSSEENEFGVRAMESLDAMGAGAFMDRIAGVLTLPGSTDLKIAALQILSRHPETKFVDRIRAVLSGDASPTVAMEAALALSRMGRMTRTETLPYKLIALATDRLHTGSGGHFQSYNGPNMDLGLKSVDIYSTEAGDIAALLDSKDVRILIGALDLLRYYYAREHADKIATLLRRPECPSEAVGRAMETLHEWQSVVDGSSVARLLWSDEPDLRIKAVEWLREFKNSAYHRDLVRLLSDTPRRAAIAALTDSVGDLPESDLPVMLAAAMRNPADRLEILAAAKVQFQRDAGLVRAIPWIGARHSEELPPLPLDRADAREDVRSLQRVWQLAVAGGHQSVVLDAGSVARRDD